MLECEQNIQNKPGLYDTSMKADLHMALKTYKEQ